MINFKKSIAAALGALVGVIVANPAHAVAVKAEVDTPFYQSSYFWSIIALALVLFIAAMLVAREKRK